MINAKEAREGYIYHLEHNSDYVKEHSYGIEVNITEAIKKYRTTMEYSCPVSYSRHLITVLESKGYHITTSYLRENVTITISW